MRVKTFTATSMSRAMQLVRAEMGEDALILSSETSPEGVRVVAAVEAPEPEDEADWLDEDAAEGRHATSETYRPRPPRGEAGPAAPPAPSRQPPAGILRDVLAWHGVPTSLALRLLRAANLSGEREPVAALALALESTFQFRPMTSESEADEPLSGALMLVGPPGAGKTLMAAKLIVDAHRRGRTVVAASCDTRRAGGVEQLRAFTRILDLPLALIDGPEALRALAAAPGADVVVIDTAGTCPWFVEEKDQLQRLIEAAKAEPVLVTPAAGDATEAAETAAAFVKLGCRRMLATRVDVSRRLGALLAAAGAGLAFAGAGIGPEAADPPAAVEALPFAKLLFANVSRAAAQRRPLLVRGDADPSETAAPTPKRSERKAPSSETAASTRAQWPPVDGAADDPVPTDSARGDLARGDLAPGHPGPAASVPSGEAADRSITRPDDAQNSRNSVTPLDSPASRSRKAPR